MSPPAKHRKPQRDDPLSLDWLPPEDAIPLPTLEEIAEYLRTTESVRA